MNHYGDGPVEASGKSLVACVLFLLPLAVLAGCRQSRPYRMPPYSLNDDCLTPWSQGTPVTPAPAAHPPPPGTIVFSVDACDLDLYRNYRTTFRPGQDIAMLAYFRRPASSYRFALFHKRGSRWILVTEYHDTTGEGKVTRFMPEVYEPHGRSWPFVLDGPGLYLVKYSLGHTLLARGTFVLRR